MAGFSGLGLHPDVVAGVKALHAGGHRLATLTNGNTKVAEDLFTAAGIRGDFDRCSRWRMLRRGSPAGRRTSTLLPHAASGRRRCCWSPFTLGTFTARHEQAWLPRGSTGLAGHTRTISMRLITPYPSLLNWPRPCLERAEAGHGRTIPCYEY